MTYEIELAIGILQLSRPDDAASYDAPSRTNDPSILQSQGTGRHCTCRCAYGSPEKAAICESNETSNDSERSAFKSSSSAQHTTRNGARRSSNKRTRNAAQRCAT
jgi:hypothetical protein